MTREINKLSAAKVATLKEPGRYADGGGLYLQISKWDTKSWIFRYQLDGKARHMGLGAVHTFSLSEARKRAKEARQLVADGKDPIELKQAARAADRATEAKRLTFSEAAEKYIAAHRAGWKNVKHADQWANTLTTYAAPVIGNLDVAAVEIAHVMKILEPIWTDKPETASRLRGRIESVLDWATARGYRQGENPARWRGHLDKLLPARSKIAKVKHQPALPHVELPAFMERLRKLPSMSARALEFTILAAARSGETRGATWQEIDLAAKVWTIPAGRMKAEREHRVPLSDRAVAILKALPREDGTPYVFPGASKGKPLSDMALLQCLRGLHEGVTTHGFRSTFRDWSGELTNFPREVAEAALAHVVGDKAEQAYRRGDALEKRRKLMEAWSRYCETKPANDKNVTPIRAVT